MSHADLREHYEAVAKAKAALLAAIRARGPEPVEDWELRRTDGAPVRLSELFGDHNDLLVVHNMGGGCRYCTLWADGFRGIAEQLMRRSAFVLCSADEPMAAAAFAESRGWDYPVVSGHQCGFARAMGFADDTGRVLPGVSAFHREADGSIVRTGHMPFGPGDDFCAVWPLFDLLKDGKGEYVPS